MRRVPSRHSPARPPRPPRGLHAHPPLPPRALRLLPPAAARRLRPRRLQPRHAQSCWSRAAAVPPPDWPALHSRAAAGAPPDWAALHSPPPSPHRELLTGAAPHLRPQQLQPAPHPPSPPPRPPRLPVRCPGLSRPLQPRRPSRPAGERGPSWHWSPSRRQPWNRAQGSRPAAGSPQSPKPCRSLRRRRRWTWASCSPPAGPARKPRRHLPPRAALAAPPSALPRPLLDPPPAPALEAMPPERPLRPPRQPVPPRSQPDRRWGPPWLLVPVLPPAMGAMSSARPG